MLKFLLGGPLSLVLGFLGSVAPGLAAAIGDTVIKAKQTEAARQGEQDKTGAELAGSWLTSVTEANRARAEARAREGSWGLITFAVGLAFACHVWAIMLDSLPFHLTLTTKFYVVPWLQWAPHQVGSWGVAALPGKFQDVELAVLQALFYVAPPAAAAVVVAKAFRR
jgi:hypothetical protein